MMAERRPSQPKTSCDFAAKICRLQPALWIEFLKLHGDSCAQTILSFPPLYSIASPFFHQVLFCGGFRYHFIKPFCSFWMPASAVKGWQPAPRSLRNFLLWRSTKNRSSPPPAHWPCPLANSCQVQPYEYQYCKILCIYIYIYVYIYICIYVYIYVYICIYIYVYIYIY